VQSVYLHDPSHTVQLTMTISPTTRRSQQGSMLLEALISILIFSMGILAIVGLQATSIKLSSDAKYRSDASMLANQHLAMMWADIASAVTASAANVATPFDAAEFDSYNGNSSGGFSGGANFDNWYNNLTATLPGASATVSTTAPILVCGNTPSPTCGPGFLQSTRTDVSISISWQLPSGDMHTYSTTAMVSAQKQL